VVVSRYHNAGQIYNLLNSNKFFENVAKFKYLGRTLTNQNYIHEDVKNRLSSGNACYYSVRITCLPVSSLEI